MSPAERRDRVSELKAVLQGQVHLQRHYLSVHQNEERSRQEVDRLDKAIAKMQADRDRLVDAIENWQKHYLDAVERVEELRTEILYLENQDKIDKLLELQAKLLAAD